MQFIQDNMIYPPEAVKDKIEGRVITQFVINEDGSIGQAKVVRGVHPLLDEEVLRIVSLLPKFMPAKQNGKCIKVVYTLPITFILRDNDPATTE